MISVTTSSFIPWPERKCSTIGPMIGLDPHIVQAIPQTQPKEHLYLFTNTKRIHSVGTIQLQAASQNMHKCTAASSYITQRSTTTGSNNQTTAAVLQRHCRLTIASCKIDKP